MQIPDPAPTSDPAQGPDPAKGPDPTTTPSQRPVSSDPTDPSATTPQEDPPEPGHTSDAPHTADPAQPNPVTTTQAAPNPGGIIASILHSTSPDPVSHAQGTGVSTGQPSDPARPNDPPQGSANPNPNPGGIIASILHGASPNPGSQGNSPTSHAVDPAHPSASPQNPAAENPGGIIASLLGQSNHAAGPTGTVVVDPASSGEIPGGTVLASVGPHGGTAAESADPTQANGGGQATAVDAGSQFAGSLVTTVPAGMPDRPGASVMAAGSLTLTVSSITHGTSPATLAVVGSQTLAMGGSAITVSGQTLSLGSSGVAVLQSQTTQILTAVTIAPSINDKGGQSLVAAGSITLTVFSMAQGPGSSTVAVIGSQTLAMGGPAVTVSDQTISLGSSGLVALQSQTTQLMTAVTVAPSINNEDPASSSGTDSMNPASTAGGPSPTGAAVFVAGTLTVTAALVTSATGNSSPQSLSVDGTTLSIGGQPLVSGEQTISFASSGLVMVDGSTTQLLTSHGTVAASDLSTTGSVIGQVTDASTPTGNAASSTTGSSTASSLTPGRSLLLGICLCVTMILHGVA